MYQQKNRAKNTFRETQKLFQTLNLLNLLPLFQILMNIMKERERSKYKDFLQVIWNLSSEEKKNALLFGDCNRT